MGFRLFDRFYYAADTVSASQQYSDKDVMTHSRVRNTCRTCGAPLFEKPLLRYVNMPGAAQHLPTAETLELDKGVDLEVCQCSGCGLVQLSNEPVPYYRDVIRAAAYSPEMKLFRLNQFADFVSRFSLVGKKVLEVGCGKGEFLSLMQQCGVDAFGVEHAADSVAECVSSGLKVTRGFAESGSCNLPDAPFNAFFILNFLEHLPDLNSVLQGISENLHDDAVGLVEVPNFDMILEKKLFSEFIGDHLYYFTIKSLTSVLTRNGFEVFECNVVWHNYIISAVVKKRTPLDISSFAEFQSLLISQLWQHIAGFGEKRVAVWGAGHQALAILALSGLADKVKYVVDSAPFKQGRFTPATHIPIVPPDQLKSDPVDAVIIMAASYSDEVARVLRRDFDTRLNVAILRESGLEGVS